MLITVQQTNKEEFIKDLMYMLVNHAHDIHNICPLRIEEARKNRLNDSSIWDRLDCLHGCYYAEIQQTHMEACWNHYLAFEKKDIYAGLFDPKDFDYNLIMKEVNEKKS